jgi:hypothetical protein
VAKHVKSAAAGVQRGIIDRCAKLDQLKRENVSGVETFLQLQ